MPPPPRRSRRTRRRSRGGAVAASLLVSCGTFLGPGGIEVALARPAVEDPGASTPRTASSDVFPPVVPGTYAPPVHAPVRDGFRMDAGPYGPGNRGLEYDTGAGATVRAIGAGRVVFVGPVAGRWALTVLHPDGRRSSLTGIVEPRVAVGELVVRGQVLAAAGGRLHLGVREGERYVDPAPLFAATRRRAVLVPLGGRVGG